MARYLAKNVDRTIVRAIKTGDAGLPGIAFSYEIRTSQRGSSF
jgi:hypothetical protein